MSYSRTLFIAYSPEKSWARNMHPATKIIIVALIDWLTYLFTDILSVALLTVMAFTLLLCSKSSLKVIRPFIAGLVGVVQFLTITYMLFTNIPGQTVFFERKIVFIGGAHPWIWHIRITDGTLLYALTFDLRILTFFFSILFFLVSTTEKDILHGLKGLKIPFSVSLVVSLMFRSMTIFSEDYNTIKHAMMSKGEDFSSGGIARKIKRYVHILIALMILGIEKSREISLAIEARGIPLRKKGRSVYNVKSLGKADVIALTLILSFTVTSILLKIYFGFEWGHLIRMIL